MKSKSISVDDIRNLVKGKIEIEMPDYKATCSARQMVTYTKKAYKGEIPEGVDIETTTNTETNTITISVVRK